MSASVHGLVAPGSTIGAFEAPLRRTAAHDGRPAGAVGPEPYSVGPLPRRSSRSTADLVRTSRSRSDEPRRVGDRRGGRAEPTGRVLSWLDDRPILGAPDLASAIVACGLSVGLSLSRWRRRRLAFLASVSPAGALRLRRSRIDARRLAGTVDARRTGGAVPAVGRVPSTRGTAAPLVPARRIRAQRGRPVVTLREVSWFALSAATTLLAVSYAPMLGLSALKTQLPDWVGLAAPPAVVAPAVPPAAAPTAPAGAVVAAKADERPSRAHPRPGSADRYRIAWPYDILDGLTFGPDGATKTRLAGLEGPGRDAVCNDRDSRPWACGLQARAALNNVTRRQDLTCEAAPGTRTDVVLARCKGEVDVAREMVLAGFARPSGHDTVLEAAEDDARRNSRGLWNGGWTIRLNAK